jgi:hypothetical protein
VWRGSWDGHVHVLRLRSKVNPWKGAMHRSGSRPAFFKKAPLHTRSGFFTLSRSGDFFTLTRGQKHVAPVETSIAWNWHPSRACAGERVLGRGERGAAGRHPSRARERESRQARSIDPGAMTFLGFQPCQIETWCEVAYAARAIRNARRFPGEETPGGRVVESS